MAKRYRLTDRAQINGVVCEPGHEFTLPDGAVGPHRTVVASNHGAQVADNMNENVAVKDIPLYVEVTDPPPPPSERETVEQELADAEARVEDLKAKLADLTEPEPVMIEDRSGEPAPAELEPAEVQD